ncbi:hypothetical protein NHQ30_011342 [Ciborinia camelliae]|nr:hypothetical protein NHQ30_011342 [Ciborinia camelliae]
MQVGAGALQQCRYWGIESLTLGKVATEFRKFLARHATIKKNVLDYDMATGKALTPDQSIKMLRNLAVATDSNKYLVPIHKDNDVEIPSSPEIVGQHRHIMFHRQHGEEIQVSWQSLALDRDRIPSELAIDDHMPLNVGLVTARDQPVSKSQSPYSREMTAHTNIKSNGQERTQQDDYASHNSPCLVCRVPITKSDLLTEFQLAIRERILALIKSIHEEVLKDQSKIFAKAATRVRWAPPGIVLMTSAICLKPGIAKAWSKGL